MTDTALENAKQKKVLLVDQISQAEEWLKAARAEILKIDAFVAEWHAYAKLNAKGAPKLDDMPSVPVAAQKPQPNSKKEEVALLARTLIEIKGAPMTRNELMPKLREMGVVINGTDPDMVLSTMLWRMRDQIVRLSKHGYWLADRPYTPAGYIPGQVIEA